MTLTCLLLRKCAEIEISEYKESWKLYVQFVHNLYVDVVYLTQIYILYYIITHIYERKRERER